jgi:hypothetical protein
MTSQERIDNLLTLVSDVESQGIEGNFVECGVWKCGMLGLMSLAKSTDREVFGFDSFEGLPAPELIDGESSLNWGGKLNVSIEEAQMNLSAMGANATLVKGFFNKTLRNSKEKIGKISILRLDGDWYESTMTCLNELYDQVSPGGYIVIDDYGHWEGCKKATDEFRKNRNITAALNQTDYTEVWWKK